MNNSIICQLDSAFNDKSIFNLLFRSKFYPISSEFCYLNDISPMIFKQLLETKQYIVKSDVDFNVFKSFVDYLTTRKVPDITFFNLNQYKLLSEEFDVMKDLIQIYQKQVLSNFNISLLMRKQDHLKKDYQFDIKNLKLLNNKYQKTIKILFTNKGIQTQEKFDKVKKELENACKKEKIYEVNYLTQITVEENGLSYIINEEDKTASVYCCLNEQSDIFIPKTVKYKNQDFSVTSILKNSFYYNNSVKTVRFPKDSELKVIQKQAFNTSDIEKITIPPHVVKICNEAFANCFHLKSFEFSENSEIQTIEDHAFLGSRIEKLVIPSSIMNLSFSCFESIKYLNDIKVLDQKVKNLTYFDDKFILGKLDSKSGIFDILILARRDIVHAEIPDFIKIIAPNAFENCTQLKTVTFSKKSKLVSIGERSFRNSKIESISIPSNVSRIDYSAFEFCEKLSNVEIPLDTRMNSIGSYSFSYCPIESFTIPSQIVLIDSGAFLGCDKLKIVNISDNSELKFLNENSFKNTKIEEISIPSKVEYINSNCFAESTKLLKIKLNKNNPFFMYYKNSFLIGKLSPLSSNFDVLLFVRPDSRYVKVPDFVKTIEEFVFNSCKMLKSVDFSWKSELISIPKKCFKYALFEKITIPSKITSIKYESFRECENLTFVDFNPHSQLKVIEKGAFKYSNLVSFSLPIHVESIGDEAFYKTNLKIIEFPDESELKFIGENSFKKNQIEIVLMPSRLNKFIDLFGAYFDLDDFLI